MRTPPLGKDRLKLHEWIYRLKTGEAAEPCLDWLVSLRHRYGAAGLVFGCTELHLLRGLIAACGDEASCGTIIDPLWIAARDLKKILAPRSAWSSAGTKGLTV